MQLKAIMAVVMASIFIPILIAVIIAFYRKKQSTHTQRTIRQLVVFALISQLIAYSLWQAEINNLPLLHLYTAIEFLMIIRFYHTWTTHNTARKRLKYLGGFFILTALINLVFYQSIFEMNAVVRGLEALIIILLALLFWIKIMRELRIQRLVESPVFWFNTAFLIYFSVNFILFIFSSDLNKLAVEKTIQPWLVHSLFMTIYYILLAIGLWKKPLQ